jgi:hypothetical protein
MGERSGPEQGEVGIDVDVKKQKKQRQTIAINSVESKNKIGQEARDSKELDKNKGRDPD